ncbi:MAG: hypothetical protein WC243_00180, partial [Patescibacteria group bacterium]
TKVLGDSSNRLQLSLYEEGSVLGSSAESTGTVGAEDTQDNDNLFEQFWHLVERFDSFVIDVLMKIFGVEEE